MNTNNVKKYAPKARRDFIAAIQKQATKYGVTAKKIHPVEVKGDVALVNGTPFPSKLAPKIEKLSAKVKAKGYQQTMEQVAYSWFNRLVAIRYMELHGYLDHGRRILSHPDHATGFQILEECTDITYGQGGQLPHISRDKVVELKLDGTKDEELYRELLLAQCHALSKAMPFLFENVDDETELLLPENLTKTDSLINDLVTVIPEEDWEHVEIVGWLYQFYISERKDEVIGKVVKSEDIPAATQLFTPNWIVKYLVQNSVGRQWVQSYPDSAIKSEMEYYIEPAKQASEVQTQLDAITPKDIDPLTIKILDPACGSGHILVEAYRILKAIYEERGFRSRDIPQLILENNIFGIDIDDRSAQLAGFALMMLAREDDRHIFAKNIRFNILSIQETKHLELESIWRDAELPDDDTYKLAQDIWQKFELGKTLGSMIDVRNEYEGQLEALLKKLSELEEAGEFLQRPAVKTLTPIIHQAYLLSKRYDAVVANPPYMNTMFPALKSFVSQFHPDAKPDLFSVFIERCGQLTAKYGYVSMITMQSWLFLSSFIKLREKIIKGSTIESLVQIGYNTFPSMNSKIAQGVSFTIRNIPIPGFLGNYYNLNIGAKQSANKELIFREHLATPHIRDQLVFLDIPSCPFAYWIDPIFYKLFKHENLLSHYFFSDGLTKTGDNEIYLRYWWEVDLCDFHNKEKYISCVKGGDLRHFYGNDEYIIRWEPTIREHFRKDKVARITPKYLWNKEGITWSKITSSVPSFRLMESGLIAETVGPAIFPKEGACLYSALGMLNSCFAEYLLPILNPTVSLQSNDVLRLPFPEVLKSRELEDLSIQLKEIYERDWKSLEISKDFDGFSAEVNYEKDIEEFLNSYANGWAAITDKAIKLQAESNRFITSSLGLDHILCFNNNFEKISLKRKLLAANKRDFIHSVIPEFLSFSIGCIMGRYSLDREGLVYAHSNNEGFAELKFDGAYRTFPADDDGIIPLTDQEWFPDDATNRFREFVGTVWGEEKLQKNLDFIAESLCLHAIKSKKGESSLDCIRRYLSTQYYKDHLKTYKKRPIYWLFSSGKLKSFECLVYLHRYNEGTLARMRTEYVIPLSTKLTSHVEKLENDKESSSSAAEASKLKKEIESLYKQQAELARFDEKLKHFADRRIKLDLDDGVKFNYGKFGDLLADVNTIHGGNSGTIK